MQSDVSFERRLRQQEMAIARLMCEQRLLRDENAELLAQLEATRRPAPAAAGVDRREGTLLGSRAAARAALTRWLSRALPVSAAERVGMAAQGDGRELDERSRAQRGARADTVLP